MKNFKLLFLSLITIGMFLTSCERVAPNAQGVLMENYGKNGKKDFSLQKGRVWTFSPGVELFQVPLWDQRGEFSQSTSLKAADNTAFFARPVYSYKPIEDRAIDLVFDNKHISGSDFMESLEDNILEPRIYDLIKEESRKYYTDSLMAAGGSLRFGKALEKIVEEEFEKRGLKLLSFSAQLQFSKKVTEKIDNRNEVNTNITVIDQQIEEQKKRNELARLQAQENIILSEGLTPQILRKMEIEAWAKYGAKVPTTVVSNGGQFMVTAPTTR